MADPLKAGRQGMQQEPADKLIGGQGHLSVLLTVRCTVLFILERHLAVVHTEQSMIANGDTMGITAQILDDLAGPPEGGLGINDPFALPERSRQIPEGLGLGEPVKCAFEEQFLFVERLLKCFQKQAPKEARQYPDTEKKAWLAVDPAGMIMRFQLLRHGTQAAAGDDTVDVRMMGKRLPPGVKNGEKPDFGAEVFRVSGYGLKCGRGGGEQQFVEHGLIL